MGHKVRYDGKDKFNGEIRHYFDDAFEFDAICPEVEIGMGVPRAPIILIQKGTNINAICTSTPPIDLSQPLRDYANSQYHSLTSVSGYIFKKSSPSCGINSAKVICRAENKVKYTSGIFASVVTAHFPSLPVIEEDGLASIESREKFIRSVRRYYQERVRAGATLPNITDRQNKDVNKLAAV